MKSRRERKEEAKNQGVNFEPQYSSGERADLKGNVYVVGGEPRTYEEAYGVGIERFNNKYVTIKEVETKYEDS